MTQRPDPDRDGLTRRRLLGVGGGAAASLSAGALLSACNASSTGGTGAAGAAGSPTAAAADAASSSPAPAGGGAKTQLVFWDNIFGGLGNTTGVPKSRWFISQAIAKFQAANPDITIDRSTQSADIETWHNQLHAANIARNGPDIISIYAGSDVTTFQASLAPLDQYFPAGYQATISGWYACRANFDPKGSIRAVPFGAGSYFEVFYNKRLLAKAGITSFTPPATWEDLLTFAARVKAGGVTPFVVGEQEGYTGAWVMAALAGGSIGTDGFLGMRSGKVPITDAAMTKGYAAYARLYSEGLTNRDATSRKNAEATSLFAQSKGAMIIGGGWLNSTAGAVIGAANVGNFKIPTLAGAPFAGAVAGGPNEALAITAYSGKREAAVRFLKFMLDTDTQNLYVQLTQTEASNNAAANTALITNPLLKNQATWLKTSKTIYPFDNIMATDVNSTFYRMNAAVFAGRTSPQSAAATIEATYKSGS